VFSPDSSLLAVELGKDVVLIECASGKEVRRFKGHEIGILSVDFSPDGRKLVSGGYDLTAILWDVTGMMKDGQFPEQPVKDEALQGLWADLADANAASAHKALWKMVAAPKQSVPLLKSRLKPVPAVDAKRVEQLVTELGSADFSTRERAA